MGVGLAVVLLLTVPVSARGYFNLGKRQTA
jgi:hypothetical protein